MYGEIEETREGRRKNEYVKSLLNAQTWYLLAE